MTKIYKGETMKHFIQRSVLVAGLVGLTGCAALDQGEKVFRYTLAV